MHSGSGQMILHKENKIISIPCEVHLLYEKCAVCIYFRPDENHFYKKGELIPELVKITCERAHVCAYVKELLNES